MALSAALIDDLNKLSRRRTFVSRANYTVRIQMVVNGAAIRQGFDRWENAVLFQTGAWIRTRIKRSMRSGRKIDARQRRKTKNRPPYRWEGLLAKLVLFDVDLKRSRVRWGVGRVKTSSTARKGIPRTLEEGGAARVEVIRRTGPEPQDFRFDKIRVKYRKFPYIAPQKQPAIDFMKRKMEELNLGT